MLKELFYSISKLIYYIYKINYLFFLFGYAIILLLIDFNFKTLLKFKNVKMNSIKNTVEITQ